MYHNCSCLGNCYRRISNGAFSDKPQAKRSKFLLCDGLATERESGGNSEFEVEEDENGEGDGYSSAGYSQSEDENSVDELSAESDDESGISEDEEELERLVIGEKEPSGEDEEELRADSQREINPFCVDFTEEDPWANVQQHTEGNCPDISPIKSELQATMRKANQRKLKQEKRRKKQLEIKRKKERQEALIKEVSNITVS